MKNKKTLKTIITSSFVFCSLVLLVGILFVKPTEQKEINTQDLVVNEGVSSDSNIKLRANARVESGVTKVRVDALTKGDVAGPGSWYNKQLNWSLEWATTKSDLVSEYVKLDILSNFSVELTYLKQFDSQIILKATSVEVSSVFATCTVDCYKRSNFNNYKLQLNGEEYSVDFSNGYFNLSEVMGDYDLINGRPVDLVIVNNDTKVGTIETATRVVGYYELSEELKTALRNKGYTNFNEIQFKTFAEKDVFTNLEYMCSNEFELIDKQNGELLNTELHEILEEIDCWFTLFLAADDMCNDESVNSSTFEFDILINHKPAFGQMNSITLQKEAIIF